MASLNPSDIITTLKSGNYPYELQFYESRQRFVIYPSVEVVKTKPDSRTANDPTKYTVSSAFEIKLYIKFTRSENAEETDRAKIENEMLRVLEEADTEPKGKIFFERPVGIGDHPNHIDDMDELISKAASANDKLNMLKKMFEGVYSRL